MDFQNLERIIRTKMRKRNTPGMAIAVIKDNETIYAKGFGARDLKQQKVMDADTLIGIGSITKSFTAMAIMQLQEQGKLNLEDSAAKHLDVEPFISRPEITLRHMLSHSTGITSLDAGMLGFNYAFDDFSNLYPATSRDDFYAHLADVQDFTLFKPGEKFFYNNDMYTCLGFVVEAVSGQSFEDYLQEHILTPLAMNRAVLTQEAFDADPAENTMTGYRFTKQGDKMAATQSDIPIGGHVQAPGGIYASMNEMLNYAKCLLNKGEFNGQQVLKPESVAELFSPQIETPYGEGDKPHYALGWSIESPSDAMPYRVIHHGGGMSTSQSFLLLVPELNIAIVAAENASTGITPLIARVVVAEALGKNPEQAIEDLRIGKVLDEIEGTYKSAHNLYTLTVGRKGGVLRVDLQTDDGSFSFPLIPSDLDKLEFSVYSLRANSKAKVVFYRNKDSGKVEYAAYDRFLYRRI